MYEVKSGGRLDALVNLGCSPAKVVSLAASQAAPARTLDRGNALFTALAPEAIMQIVVVKEVSEARFRLNRDGRKVQAQKVNAALVDAQMDGEIKLPPTKHGESRADVDKYDLGDGYRLVVFRTGEHCIFVYVGKHDDVDRWLDLGDRVDRNRNLALLLRPKLSRSFAGAHAELVDRCGAVVRGAAQAAQARVVVESSKHPSYGLVLGAHPDLDVRVVHVVRDSRGVAYSWTKRVPRPEITDRVEYMPTYPPAQIAGRWLAWNGALSALASRRRRPTLRIRYEDFVHSPTAVMQAIAAFAGNSVSEDVVAALLASGPRRGQHSVAGNPLRFGDGPIELRADEQWRRDLPTRQRRLVTAMTAPLLRLYGYRLRGGVT